MAAILLWLLHKHTEQCILIVRPYKLCISFLKDKNLLCSYILTFFDTYYNLYLTFYSSTLNIYHSTLLPPACRYCTFWNIISYGGC